MLTGWLNDSNGNTYYMDKTDGNMSRGWKQIDGTWYYFNEYGHRQKGWIKVSGTYYYLDENGKMASNTTRTIDSVKYTFAKSGACQNPPSSLSGMSDSYFDPSASQGTGTSSGSSSSSSTSGPSGTASNNSNSGTSSSGNTNNSNSSDHSTSFHCTGKFQQLQLVKWFFVGHNRSDSWKRLQQFHFHAGGTSSSSGSSNNQTNSSSTSDTGNVPSRIYSNGTTYTAPTTSSSSSSGSSSNSSDKRINGFTSNQGDTIQEGQTQGPGRK